MNHHKQSGCDEGFAVIHLKDYKQCIIQWFGFIVICLKLKCYRSWGCRLGGGRDLSCVNIGWNSYYLFVIYTELVRDFHKVEGLRGLLKQFGIRAGKCWKMTWSHKGLSLDLALNDIELIYDEK